MILIINFTFLLISIPIKYKNKQVYHLVQKIFSIAIFFIIVSLLLISGSLLPNHLSMQSMQSFEGDQPSFNKYFLQDPSLLQYVNQKQQKKIVLYDIPQIQVYRKLNKPVVDEQKKRMIKQKLDLQQESLLQTKQRQKRNQYFLNYSENPFIELAPHLRHINKQASNKKDFNLIDLPSKQNTNKQTLNPDQSNIKKYSNNNPINDIVFQLNALKEKPLQSEFLRMQYDFQRLKKDTSLMSKKTIQTSAYKVDFQFFKNKKLHAQQLVKGVYNVGRVLAADRRFSKQKSQTKGRGGAQMRQQNKQTYSNPAIALLPDNTMAFQQILQIKQENYFMKTSKKLNIFKIAFNKNEQEIMGRQLLNKYYFNFTSMVQKLQKIKISIYRDISRMARRISLNLSTGKQDRFDYIDSYQLSFKTNMLSFADLMSVASGRFTPQFVSKTTNFDVEQNVAKEKSQTSSQEEQEEIFYHDNTKNVSVRYHNRGQQQQQIKNYLKLQFNSRQKSYMSRCQKYKDLINQDLKMKQKLVSTTIQDRQLHGVINRSVKKQLKQFVNMDQRDIQIDRLIRMNKSHKNKNTSIKMEKVLEAFDIKKQHDMVINNLGILKEPPAYQKQDEHLELNDKDQEKLKRIKSSSIQTIVNYSKTAQIQAQQKDTNKKTQKKSKNSITPQKSSKYQNTTDKNNLSATPRKQNSSNNQQQRNRTPTKTNLKQPKWVY